MNRIVVLHSHHEKQSREFVATQCEGYQVIDWYGEGQDVSEYLNLGLQGASQFPTVVDTVLKVWYVVPSTMQQALDSFSDYIMIGGQPHKKNGLSDLDYVKKYRIQSLSDESMVRRRRLLPDYKLINAALGIYSDTDKAKYKKLCEDFRTEFYRLNAIVDASTNKDEILSLQCNWPTSIT